MPKYSAHCIYPVTSPPVPFGIIETDDHGSILKIRDTGGKPVEEAGLEFHNGIIVPGFVNAHCHLELSHLKGLIPEASGLTDFVTSVTKLRNNSPDSIQLAIRNADQAMQSEGIIAVGDISNTADTAEIKKTSPIRYHTFLEVFGLDPASSETRFAQASLSSFFFNLSSLSPHAPYSVGKTLWQLLRDHPELTRRISIHHAESEEERELLEYGTGPMADAFRRLGFDLSQIPHNAADIFALLNDYLPDSEVLLVHNLTADRRQQTADRRPQTADRRQSSAVRGQRSAVCGLRSAVFFVLCPSSNHYIHRRLPDFAGFAQSGEIICLGTDSLASNHRLSIIEEMRWVQEHAPGLSFDTILRWATHNGALALGMEKEIGSLEPGKIPGLVSIRNFDVATGKLLPGSRARRLI